MFRSFSADAQTRRLQGGFRTAAGKSFARGRGTLSEKRASGYTRKRRRSLTSQLCITKLRDWPGRIIRHINHKLKANAVCEKLGDRRRTHLSSCWIFQTCAKIPQDNMQGVVLTNGVANLIRRLKNRTGTCNTGQGVSRPLCRAPRSSSSSLKRF